MNSKDEILNKVQEIARIEIDNDAILLEFDTLASDIDGWDSISLLQIITALEDYYGITFSALAIQNWKNIGDLCQSIQQLT